MTNKNRYIKIKDRGLPLCPCGRNALRIMTPLHIKSKTHQSYLKSQEIVNNLFTDGAQQEVLPRSY